MTTEPDLYDFNAPMYVDLAQEEGGSSSSSSSHPNHPTSSTTSDSNPAMIARAAQATPTPQPADPWDFDAPTWTDLAASSTVPASRASSSSNSSNPPSQPQQELARAPAPVAKPAAAMLPTPQRNPSPTQQAPKKLLSPLPASSSPAPAAASSSSPHGPVVHNQQTQPPVAIRRASGSPASVVSLAAKLSLSDTNSPPIPQRATASVTAAAAPFRMQATTPERMPASPKASSMSPADDDSHKPATTMACRMPPSVAPPAVPRPAITTTTTTTATMKNKTGVRTFMNRPRKESLGPSAAPVQHHSYLAHTTASSRHTVVVDNMASFLRPTASSWSRNQTETATATTVSSMPTSKVIHGHPPSRPAGPVRALSKNIAGKATTTNVSAAAARSAGGARAREVVKESTEERQMRLAAEAKERLKQQMRANRTAYERNRMVGGSTASAPLRSTKALTIPQSPQLSLNARHGEKYRRYGTQEPQVDVYYKPRPPPSTSSSTNYSKGSKPLTIPVAPSFATDTRAHVRRASPTYQGSHASVEAFSHSHPPPLRINRSSGGGMGLREYTPKEPSPRTLTVPKTPNLTTKTRAAVRKSTGVAHMALETEKQEMGECGHQFKAQPLDRRMLHSTGGEIGGPKAVAKGGLTEPQPFHFKTTARVRRVPTSADQEGESFAMPKDKKQLHHEGKSHDSLVVPKPFQLATEKRGQMHKMIFEARLAQDREAEEAAHKVHALPVPDFHRGFQPQPSVRPLTEFAPFHLSSGHEGTQSQREVESCMDGERQVAQQGHRARPLPASTYRRGVEIKPSERQALFPMTMNLSTSIRAAERKAYDAERQARQEAERAEQVAMQEELRQETERKIRRERLTPTELGGSHFVAKPILHSSHPMKPATSVRKLTVPISPHLHSDKRSLTQHRHQDS